MELLYAAHAPQGQAPHPPVLLLHVGGASAHALTRPSHLPPPGRPPDAHGPCAEALPAPLRGRCDPDQIRELAGVTRKALNS